MGQHCVQYGDAALREPYGGAVATAVVRCQAVLRQFIAISDRRCGPDQVNRLVELAEDAQMFAWDAAAIVYRR